jgi:hypothetical protein
LLGRLAADASYFRPEPFSVYGVSHDGRPFLGWGMQLREDEAVFYQPGAGAMSVSSSADHTATPVRRAKARP